MHCPTRTLVLRVEIWGVIAGLFACSAGTPTVDMKSAKFTMYHIFTSRPTTITDASTSAFIGKFSQPGSKVVTKRALWPFGSSF